MFSGTIRSNLDVDGTRSDDELWSALEKVSLKSAFEEYDDGLEHQVLEQGSNLSAGTVQLVCLARVLLKNPMVLFMVSAVALSKCVLHAPLTVHGWEHTHISGRTKRLLRST